MADINILIVEDEASTAVDIENQLRSLGFNVCGVAFSGEEAIAAAEKLKPNLILMKDSIHSELDSIEIAKEISQQQHVPLIFLTTHSNHESFNRIKNILPYGCLTQPFTPSDLRISIELALLKFKMEMESVAESNRVKNDLLGNLSHEFRTPLNTIIGYSEMIATELAGPVSETQKEFIQYILTSSKDLLRLLDNLLDLSRIESFDVKFEAQDIHFQELIADVKNNFAQALNEKKMSIDHFIDKNLQTIISDADKLKRVISIFLSNAIKFSPHESRIEIFVRPEGGDYFRVEVCDKGVGIHPEDIKKLFIPFQQVDQTINKKYQGAGVELALARRIIEAQHGSIGVMSAPKKGSTFFAILPITPLHDTFHQYNPSSF